MHIDLGRKQDVSECCSPGQSTKGKKQEVTYPSTYVHGLKGKIDIDSSMLNKDIDLSGGVIRITGFDVRTTDKGEETSIDFEIRNLDLGKKKKSAADGDSIHDAITEALS